MKEHELNKILEEVKKINPIFKDWTTEDLRRLAEKADIPWNPKEETIRIGRKLQRNDIKN